MSVIASSSGSTSQTTDLSFSVDKAIHPLSAVKKAALKFTDTCTFDFKDRKGSIEVRISVGSVLSKDEQKTLINKVKTEILDQELRESIARETEPIRNLILANVFSKTIAAEDSE